MTQRALSAQQKEFARQLLVNLAHGQPRGKAATAAAKAAGYTGSSIEANARRLSQDRRIKAYMAELATPAPPADQLQAEANVIATVEMARVELSKILLADIDLAIVKPTDKIAAEKQLALIEGWNAPDRLKFEGGDFATLSDAELKEYIASEARALLAGSGRVEKA